MKSLKEQLSYLKEDLSYSRFSTPEELRSFYGITEAKESSKEKLQNAEERVSKAEDDDEKEELAAKKDRLDVVYSDLKQTPTNIFKHIIMFTNNKNPKENKTLNNIYEAIKNLKKAKCKTIPELHLFLSEDVTEDLEDETGKVTITDGEETFVIDGESNVDTLVFARLGVQGEESCEHIVSILQDRGFLVLNPIKYSAIACNKYDSACLFQKGGIPQPNFCLMNKDILYDEKQYLENMQKIYSKFSGDGDKDEQFTFVVKILDGHGGTGVMLLDGKKILAVLQTIFAIDPERELIIQRKEEADGGDIRVHVLTLRNKQVILAAMKRIKIKSDFRSNVSLGASAEKVKLTPEQEQIALKTAKLSKLPWCAVDIMPLVKGSNKELGDNVVLEINASPGTDGISEVIEHNFVNVILNELDKPTEFCLQDKVGGFMESITLDFGQGPVELLAKLDTGNGSSASHVEVGEYKEVGNNIEFTLDGKKYSLEKIGESKAKTGTEEHIRPVVNLKELHLGQRMITDVPISLVKERKKSSNVLLNRELLGYLGIVVSSTETHILTKEMEKVKIV